MENLPKDFSINEKDASGLKRAAYYPESSVFVTLGYYGKNPVIQAEFAQAARGYATICEITARPSGVFADTSQVAVSLDEAIAGINPEFIATSIGRNKGRPIVIIDYRDRVDNSYMVLEVNPKGIRSIERNYGLRFRQSEAGELMRVLAATRKFMTQPATRRHHPDRQKRNA